MYFRGNRSELELAGCESQHIKNCVILTIVLLNRHEPHIANYIPRRMLLIYWVNNLQGRIWVIMAEDTPAAHLKVILVWSWLRLIGYLVYGRDPREDIEFIRKGKSTKSICSQPKGLAEVVSALVESRRPKLIPVFCPIFACLCFWPIGIVAMFYYERARSAQGNCFALHYITHPF